MSQNDRSSVTSCSTRRPILFQETGLRAGSVHAITTLSDFNSVHLSWISCRTSYQKHNLIVAEVVFTYLGSLWTSFLSKGYIFSYMTEPIQSIRRTLRPRPIIKSQAHVTESKGIKFNLPSCMCHDPGPFKHPFSKIRLPTPNSLDLILSSQFFSMAKTWK